MLPMTEVQFLAKVRQAYIEAAVPAYAGEGIFRHRLRSTSAVQEDLVAYYIRSQHKLLMVHVDQPISFRPRTDGTGRAEGAKGQERKRTCYPDIVVIRRHEAAESDGTIGTIVALVDVKTDLGWNRSEVTFTQICDSLLEIRAGLLEQRHLPLPGPASTGRLRSTALPKLAPRFDATKLRCSKGMTCHVVVVTGNNSGDIAAEGNTRKAIALDKGVHLHVLMTTHPNSPIRERAGGSAPAAEGVLGALDNFAARSLRPDDFKSLTETICRNESP